MKTINLTEEEFNFLKDLQHELKIQDSRATSDPVFCVQQLTHEPRPEDYGHDGTYFLECVTGDYSRYNTLIEAYRSLLEMGYSKNDIRGNVEEIGYTEEWTTVQSCLTEQGAQWFINRKQHDYGVLRIYAESLYWNYEMKTLRNLLLNLTLE